MLDFAKMNKVVGIKQAKKALKENRASRVFIALDADRDVAEPIRELCLEAGVPVTDFSSMKELGTECKIEVGAAVVAELK